MNPMPLDLSVAEQREADRRWARVQAARFGGYVAQNLEHGLWWSAEENARVAARWALEARPELCPGRRSTVARLRPEPLRVEVQPLPLRRSWAILRGLVGILRGVAQWISLRWPL